MVILKTLAFVLLVLILGDFLITFIWHVPEHAFGKSHFSGHHAKDRDFSYYAGLTSEFHVILNNTVGILCYTLILLLFKPSIWVCCLSLLLSQLHFIWKHTLVLGWQTPPTIGKLCNVFYIVTPEQHWEHHTNGRDGFGDIFTFYKLPARIWLMFLLGIKRKFRQDARVSNPGT